MNSYQANKIHTYYNNKQITSPQQLPVPFQQRSQTDIFCTISTAIFALAMFILACVVFNNQKLAYITYPTDSEGRKCTLDNPTYNYLYFTTIADPSRRVCVSQCPTGGEAKLNCLPTDQIGCAANNKTNYQVQIYPTTAENTAIGLFCFPADETLKGQLLENSNLQQRFTFVKSYRSIWISAGIAFGLGLLFLAFMCCATRPMVYISIALGGLLFIALSILLIIWNSTSYKSYSPFIFILAVIFIVFGIMLLSSLIFKQKDISVCAQYLQKGIEVLKVQTSLLLTIPVFIALTVGLIALCWFQLLSYWSNSNLAFHQNQIYYQPEGIFAVVMQFLDLLQFIWGLCFLKQAFNFIVSACAVTKVFVGDSFIMHGIKGLLRYHWGSVVASSFLLNFFYLPDLIYDFIKPNQKNKSCYNCYTSVCCCCDRLFGFARSETMAFINAVGLPYCNSSRWCERLSYLSTIFEGSQSVFRYFSLGAHVMLASLATVLGFIYSTANGTLPKQLALLFSFALNLFVVTFFVSLVKNLAESVLLSTIIHHYLRGQDMNHQNLDSSLSSNQKQATPSFNQKIQPKPTIQESNVNQGYEILPTRPY